MLCPITTILANSRLPLRNIDKNYRLVYHIIMRVAKMTYEDETRINAKKMNHHYHHLCIIDIIISSILCSFFIEGSKTIKMY